MITIDQLLESVDLDFEPRFVTKCRSGYVEIWSNKPKAGATTWYHTSEDDIYQSICKLKLAEFENKPWQECIYEVPRKVVISKMETTEPIEKLNLLNDSALLWGKKINELVAAVNELMDDKHSASNPQVTHK